MHRRAFLAQAGGALGAAAALDGGLRRTAAGPAADAAPGDWAAVRREFELRADQVHLASFFLAAHPRPVREAIERHRRGFDADPFGYFVENVEQADAAVLSAASDYLGASATEIALTDSTTMGLGLLYGGLTLRGGQEILTTTHDHYATEMSLRHAAARSGAAVRRVELYRDGSQASAAEIVEAIRGAVTAQTRVVAVTWVHSCTGVKLPVAAIAGALSRINASRDVADRALLCVDGVHGLAADDATPPALGCDFFVAGTHKWLHGPRGTGIVWGRATAWEAVAPTIPTFDWASYGTWMEGKPPPEGRPGRTNTPGGFHSFEHRWALAEAFRFHQRLGPAQVAGRIHELNRQLKEGLAAMPHVTLHTPMGDDLSAGIVCFDVAGMDPHEVVERLRERRIVGSVTPYATRYARLAPSILNNPDEIDAALRAVRALA
jgi:selenocysteine lyase/cysteine desulfurase